jgi:hypothetical protein
MTDVLVDLRTARDSASFLDTIVKGAKVHRGKQPLPRTKALLLLPILFICGVLKVGPCAGGCSRFFF